LGATRLERQNLANITKGQFEGMAAQIKSFNDFMKPAMPLSWRKAKIPISAAPKTGFPPHNIGGQVRFASTNFWGISEFLPQSSGWTTALSL
jgi:hypothetical protein